MVSIVICSVNARFLEQLKENLSSTIGVPYELLVWDNRIQKKGLCKVYNEMAAQARYPYIFFMHEDILFENHNWGKFLVGLFEKYPEVGLIGVAGSKYKSRIYSGWYCGRSDLDCYNITHRTNGKDKKMISHANSEKELHLVVCVDGVFMAARQSVWQLTRFDDEFLKGFHLYDIDFSLRAFSNCQVAVTTAVNIIHITQGGDYGENWVKETIRYHNNRQHLLPAKSTDISARISEDQIAKVWFDVLKVEPISIQYKLKWINNQKLYLKPALWYGIIKFIVFRPARLHLLKKPARKH